MTGALPASDLVTAMLRRLITSLFLALVVLFGASPALARGQPEIGELPPSGAGAAPLSGPAAVVPHDAPLVSPGLSIPPLPPSYVTKELGWLSLSFPPAA